MKNKKQIDRLFQEKFKNFEANPDENLWQQIEERLTKKKKRRVIPIWWRYAGVAALFIFLLTIGNSLYNTSNNIALPEKVVDIKNSDDAFTKNNKNESILNTNKKGVQISKTDKSDSNTNSFQTKKSQFNTLPSNTNVAENNANIINNEEKRQDAKKYINNKSQIASLTPEHASLQKDKKSISKEQDQLVLNTSKNENGVLDKNIKTTTTDSIQDNIEEKIPSQTIEEAIANNEELNEKEKRKNRWSITPNIAPVYYNTLGEGSHIDNQFINNSKTGELNTSYGVSVAYNISDKLTLRTGINNLDLSYDTDNVILFESLASLSPSGLARSSLQNINLDSSAQNISALSADNLQAQNVPSILPNGNAAISQRIGYLEIPVEIQYGLTNNNFGLNLIGGFSTFFLSNNEVVSEFNGIRNLIGEANNINNVSFSANFGVGIDYKFSEKFKFNLEPTFKYQINAYNNTFGDFNPYIFGVYTGFSFKF